MKSLVSFEALTNLSATDRKDSLLFDFTGLVAVVANEVTRGGFQLLYFLGVVVSAV
jgi:hypothetical protein